MCKKQPFISLSPHPFLFFSFLSYSFTHSHARQAGKSQNLQLTNSAKSLFLSTLHFEDLYFLRIGNFLVSLWLGCNVLFLARRRKKKKKLEWDFSCCCFAMRRIGRGFWKWGCRVVVVVHNRWGRGFLVDWLGTWFRLWVWIWLGLEGWGLLGGFVIWEWREGRDREREGEELTWTRIWGLPFENLYSFVTSDV